MEGRGSVILLLVGAVGCSVDGASTLEWRSSPIISGTPVSTDPAGYGFTINADVSGSGMFLTPQWVITAGHFLMDDDGAGRWTFDRNQADVVVGTSTTNSSGGTVFVHPKWWPQSGIGHTPPPAGPKDISFDVGLIRLNSVVDSSGYPNLMYNQLSNGFAGSTLHCFGYGSTALNGTGGGRGVLQTAVFPQTGYEMYGGDFLHPPSEAALITVGDSGTGQRLFHGDSGGTCFTEGRSPFVISGITEGFRDHPDGTHTTYLVDPLAAQSWVDLTMHGTPLAVETNPPAGDPVFTSASTKTGINHRNHVIASYGGTAAYMSVYAAGGWSAWAPLTVVPPGGIGIVGATTLLDSAGTPKLFLAQSSKSFSAPVTTTMYVSPSITPGTRGPWPAFTWISAGTAPSTLASGTRSFKGTPAIVSMGPNNTDRIDYFAYASNTIDSASGIFYRWRFNDAWQSSSWQLVPSPPNGVTIKGSPSVARMGDAYYLAARGSDQAIWINTLPGVTNSASYGGPWSGWVSIGGVVITDPTLTAWDRGVDVHVIGMEQRLWHRYTDADGSWSGWIQLGTDTFTGTVLTASNLLPSTHEIDIVGTFAGPSPRVVRFPW